AADRTPGTAIRPVAGRRADRAPHTSGKRNAHSPDESVLSEEHEASLTYEQLAGQLAEETQDDDDVQDAGGRLCRTDLRRLPGEDSQGQRAHKAQSPAYRQPDGHII